jgi:hypothetical protein
MHMPICVAAHLVEDNAVLIERGIQHGLVRLHRKHPRQQTWQRKGAIESERMILARLRGLLMIIHTGVHAKGANRPARAS